MSDRPELGRLNDIITDDDWDEVMEAQDTADNTVYEDQESEDEANLKEYEETSEGEDNQEAAADEPASEETAEADSQSSEDELPKGTPKWAIKEVTKLRSKRREAESKYEEQAKELEALRAQMRALMGGEKPETKPEPQDDFDSFMKELGVTQEDTDDDLWNDEPRVSPQVAKMLHAQQKQIQQQKAWIEQQTLREQQDFIMKTVGNIRKDHPMVPEKVLINAIARGMDPNEVALDVRSQFEEHYGSLAKPAEEEAPAPLATPPKKTGSKKPAKQPKKKASVPEWARGRGKVPNLADSIEKDLEELFG